jgi:hypothetical protein
MFLRKMKVINILILCLLCGVLVWNFTGCGGGGERKTPTNGGQDNTPGTWNAHITPINPSISDYVGTYRNSQAGFLIKVICCSSGKVFTHFHDYWNEYLEFGYGEIDANGLINVRAVGHSPGQSPSAFIITGFVEGTSISASRDDGFSWEAELRKPSKIVEKFEGEYKGKVFTETGSDFFTMGIGNDGSVIAVSGKSEETISGGGHGTIGYNGIFYVAGIFVNTDEESVNMISYSGTVKEYSASGHTVLSPFYRTEDLTGENQ